MNKDKMIDYLTVLLIENDKNVKRGNTHFKNIHHIAKVECLSVIIKNIKDGEFDDN